MNVKLKVKCIGCDLPTDLTIKAPHIVEPTIVRFNCSNCESEILGCFLKPKKSENQPSDTLSYRLKILKPSATLLQLMKEEAELRELKIEEKTEGTDLPETNSLSEIKSLTETNSLPKPLLESAAVSN